MSAAEDSWAAERAASAEASTARGAYDPAVEQPHPSELEELVTHHRGFDPECWACVLSRRVTDQADELQRRHA